MSKEDVKLSLHERVGQLQSELIAPKNQYNTFGKYKYRSGEDILTAVKPLNIKFGLFLYITDELVLIGERYYIKATAKLIDMKDVSNFIEATAHAREPAIKKGMSEDQITGATSSYARKYALNGLYLIDDTKDADTNEHTQQGNSAQGKQSDQPNKKYKNKAAPKLNMAQKNAIESKSKEFAKLRNQTVEKVMQVLNISDLDLITETYANESIGTLDKWLKKATDENVS